MKNEILSTIKLKVENVASITYETVSTFSPYIFRTFYVSLKLKYSEKRTVEDIAVLYLKLYIHLKMYSSKLVHSNIFRMTTAQVYKARYLEVIVNKITKGN